jgi:hypothetical protein
MSRRKARSTSPGFDHFMEAACERQAMWHRWFAWYPVMVNGERVWLEMLESRVPSHYDEYLRGWRPDQPMRTEYRKVYG